MSYCSGEAGIAATEASTAQNLLASSEPPSTSEPSNPEGKVEQNYSKKRIGEGDVTLDKERLAQALKEEKKRARGDDEEGRIGKRQKGGGAHEVTEEELGTFLVLYLSPNAFLYLI